MTAPPYMKLYWGDYHRKTRHLTCAQHGAYLLLIGEAWQRGGSLPDDDALLAKWALCSDAEWAVIGPGVRAFFALRRGKLVHDRVREELASYESTSRRRKSAGKTGGIASAGKKKGNPQANATLLPTKPEPEPEPYKKSPSDLRSSGRAREVATKICPADFEPDSTVWRVADENGFSRADAERQLAMMRDHQFRDAHKDWQAVARNWLRKAQPQQRVVDRQLSFGLQDVALQEAGNREFIRLVEEKYGPSGTGGGDRTRDHGVVVALPAPKALSG